MATLLYTHEAGFRHENPPGHPESVARLAAVEEALEAAEFSTLLRREAPAAAEADLLRCHPAGFLAKLRAAPPDEGYRQLDPDTWLSPLSWEAAERAAGGVCAAVDAVLAGEATNAFVAMRPPGHHAEAARPMGFCLLGNVAIAAKRALDHHGLSRVAVLDFDVHHGNGTQALLWDEARAMFVSSQQYPLWPGTGAETERGAHGQIVNLPLPSGSTRAEMQPAWEGALARVAAFRPDLVLVSAGFDAHRDDPLANLNWGEEDFAWLTGAICDLAEATCGGRVVSTLEGGYDLEALAASVAAHVRVLMERGR